ncbi:MAG: substrate-binding domain-containing protein [Ignavibacteriales bacterium]|nr:substrate-binding domain-containing protein [Ignavibacteriales bacterium]
MKPKNKYIYIILGWALLIVSIQGCLPERTETPTKGRATVVAAESVEPLMRQEKEKFESTYPDAHIELLFSSSREAVARFFNDSIRIIVTSRPLNEEERSVAEKFKIEFQEYKIAMDGVAFLVNADNPVSQIRTTQLDSIYTGLITRWNQVGGKNVPIDLFLPDQNSGNFEIVRKKILKDKKYEAPANTIKSSEEMLKVVSSHPNALGVVGLNWLSQKKDNVTVLKLSDPNAPDSLGTKNLYFAPLQAHVYRNYYPITREVYIYSRVDMYGVGAGFITYITSAPGQQLVVYNGLVPATMPIRLVELSNKGLQP